MKIKHSKIDNVSIFLLHLRLDWVYQCLKASSGLENRFDLLCVSRLSAISEALTEIKQNLKSS